MPSRRGRGPLEREIQSAILHYLWSIGYPAWHQPNAGRWNPRTKRYNIVDEDHVKGVPDLTVPCGDGVTVFFEVKRPGEGPRDAQKALHTRLLRLGHRIKIVESVAHVRMALSEWGLSKERA